MLLNTTVWGNGTVNTIVIRPTGSRATPRRSVQPRESSDLPVLEAFASLASARRAGNSPR
jgi:hypothetical protein